MIVEQLIFYSLLDNYLVNMLTCTLRYLMSVEYMYHLLHNERDHLGMLINVLLHAYICRNKDTPRDEFIFYSKRMMRLLFEFAMNMLPHKVILQYILLC